jgi:tetratricopeptide (TPR) repeat protein
MKQFVFLSLLLIAAALIFFSVKILSNLSDEKVKNFNQSLKFENDGNYKKALEEMNKIYESNKNDYLVNLRTGWLHYLLGNYEKSKTFYRTASEINPKSIEAKLGFTFPLWELQDWDQLKNIYNDILSIDKFNFTANLRLGQIYLNAEDYKNAEKYLETVQSRFPSEYEPNQSLGWTYYYLGKKEKSKELFTNVLMISPGDTLALRGIGLIK